MAAPAQLRAAAIEAVVTALSDRVGGDWLLVGGALVALWLEPRRTTEDVDLVPVSGAPNARLELMRVADEMGLPIEAVNSAAEFFVNRIPDWREQVEPFRSGAVGRVLRPSPTLFLLLKLARLSDTDLADCVALLDLVRAEGLALDTARVLAALRVLPRSEDAALEARRAALERGLTEQT